MTDIPIIFSAPMVRALLEGRKTMTRRLARTERKIPGSGSLGGDSDRIERPSPWQRVKPGDRLYVRENWSADHFWSGIKPSEMPSDHMAHTWYWADGNPNDGDWTKTIPSIFMPRWRSRITLVVTDTKIERLQDISEADAISEGIEDVGEVVVPAWRCYLPEPKSQDAWAFATESFRTLWTSLHGAENWQASPHVVALSFRVEKINIDQLQSVAA